MDLDYEAMSLEELDERATVLRAQVDAINAERDQLVAARRAKLAGAALEAAGFILAPAPAQLGIIAGEVS